MQCSSFFECVCVRVHVCKRDRDPNNSISSCYVSRTDSLTCAAVVLMVLR